MKNIKKLPEAELKVMLAVWDNTPPVSRNTISHRLEELNYSAPVILTMLSRMVKKGYLSCEKQGNKNMYTPLISKEEYMLAESASFARKVQDMSLTSLVATFVKNRGITKDELARLEDLLQQYKENSPE